MHQLSLIYINVSVTVSNPAW